MRKWEGHGEERKCGRKRQEFGCIFLHLKVHSNSCICPCPLRLRISNDQTPTAPKSPVQSACAQLCGVASGTSEGLHSAPEGGENHGAAGPRPRLSTSWNMNSLRMRTLLDSLLYICRRQALFRGRKLERFLLRHFGIRFESLGCLALMSHRSIDEMFPRSTNY